MLIEAHRLFVAVHGLSLVAERRLITVASLVAEAQALERGSVVVAQRVVGSALQMETQLEGKGKNDKEVYELEL